jgi:nicotinic acetylcholine receptor, invertebrate
LTDYEKSGSWDVFNVLANLTHDVDKDTGRKVSRAKYTIFMRRKTLFYTVNLIIPSVLVSSLSMVVFYLPATAGERITMSVSILLALIVYLQVWCQASWKAVSA